MIEEIKEILEKQKEIEGYVNLIYKLACSGQNLNEVVYNIRKVMDIINEQNYRIEKIYKEIKK